MSLGEFQEDMHLGEGLPLTNAVTVLAAKKIPEGSAPGAHESCANTTRRRS